MRSVPPPYCPPSLDLERMGRLTDTTPLPKLPYKYTVHYRTGSTFSNPRNFSKQGKRMNFTGAFKDIHKYIDSGISSIVKHKARQQAELRKLMDRHAFEVHKLEVRRAKDALATSLLAKYGVSLSPMQLARYDSAQLTEIALKRYNQKLKNQAAFLIQRHWEVYKQAKALREEHQSRHQAAAAIQAHWKGFKVTLT
jgi:hypothetical protein